MFAVPALMFVDWNVSPSLTYFLLLTVNVVSVSTGSSLYYLPTCSTLSISPKLAMTQRNEITISHGHDLDSNLWQYLAKTLQKFNKICRIL